MVVIDNSIDRRFLDRGNVLAGMFIFMCSRNGLVVAKLLLLSSLTGIDTLLSIWYTLIEIQESRRNGGDLRERKMPLL